MAGSRTGSGSAARTVAGLNSRRGALLELTATEQLLTSEDGGQEGRGTVWSMRRSRNWLRASLLGSVDLRTAT